jgi:hypothetical protein
MTAILAFSIDHQVEQIGAIAGFAAILGLGVLSLLFFAQAREVKRLREWAGRAPERDAELQQRVAEDAARRAGPPAAAVPAARPLGTAVPVTAAGQKASVKALPGPVSAAATPPASTAPGVTGSGQPAPGPTAATGPSRPAPGPTGATASSQPAPTAPGTAGTGRPVPAVAAAATPPPSASPARPTGPIPAPATAAAARQRRTVPIGSPAATAPPPSAVRDDIAPPRGGLGPRHAVAAVVLVVTAVAVLLVAGVLGGSSSTGHSKGGSATTPGATPANGAGVQALPAPADTRVAVLNGTTIVGLAAKAAERLSARGYPIGTKTDAADQAQQTSAVAYAPGFTASARKVAQILGIPASQIAPIDASTSRVAGSDADVVVTMGADKAQ